MARNFPESMALLQRLGITCQQMKWQVYYKTILTDETPLFDMILTDPPYGTPQSRSRSGSTYDNFVSDEEMKAAAQFSRKVLREGGWVFLFTSVKYFNSWHAAFRSCGFTAPEFPFVIVKETGGIQQHRGDDFPQNASEFAYFGRAPGRRTDNFRPNLRSPYHLILSKEKRKFAALSCVPVTPNKLMKDGSKSPVLVEEKNVNLLSEIMETFCPEGGSVLDMYAGTFTTALGCIRTGRKCTVIEQNTDCYRLAHERLRNVAAEFIASSSCDAPPAHKTKLRLVRPEPFLGSQTRPDGGALMTLASETQVRNASVSAEDREVAANASVGGGDVVELLIDDVVVASATLKLPVSKTERFCRTIHGHGLSEFQEEGQLLVVVYRVIVNKKELNRPYRYKFGGIEGAPQTLGDIGSSLVAWDVHEMRRAISK